MTRIITAPQVPFAVQPQASRPRNQFNLGGSSGNDEAMLLALLQFLSNQQQAQVAQEFREKQFGLERDLGERQIKESKIAETEARRARLVAEAQGRFERSFGQKTADLDASFRKSMIRAHDRGASSVTKAFTVRARDVQRALRKSPHGTEATADFQNFVQRFRDSMEEMVSQEENPIVKSGMATRFGEILIGLQQTAQEVKNVDLFNFVDEIAFSSQGFQQYAGRRDLFIEDALTQRNTALVQDKNLRLEEIQRAISSFDDPNAPVSESRVRQIVGDVVRRPLELPGFDQLTFEEPSRPFRPVGDVPGQKGFGQELLEVPGEVVGATGRFFGGTPGIRAGERAVPEAFTPGLVPFGPSFGPFPFGPESGLLNPSQTLQPETSPVEFRPDREVTPGTPVAVPSFQPLQSVPMRQGVLPPANPFGTPTIPGFRGFGGL